ncbi:hypothetical protein KCP76_20550 [Salmonella enterica subsp. enterica serovar Weltevreden]|nr:hypothetical protein KCP76_20550 [Salmonella enterica subsp. enterica serovar Weltevreden]
MRFSANSAANGFVGLYGLPRPEVAAFSRQLFSAGRLCVHCVSWRRCCSIAFSSVARINC